MVVEMPKWIIKWAARWSNKDPTKVSFCREIIKWAAKYLLARKFPRENVKWFRAVLIPQHKFQTLGGRGPPTPMTLQLCRSTKDLSKLENGKTCVSSTSCEVFVEPALSKPSVMCVLLPWMTLKDPVDFYKTFHKRGNLLDQDHHHPCVFSCLEWHWTEAGVMFEWLLSVGLWRAGLSICGKDAHLKIPHSIITRKDPDKFYNAFHKWRNLLNQEPHVNRQSNGAFSYV